MMQWSQPFCADTITNFTRTRLEQYVSYYFLACNSIFVRRRTIPYMALFRLMPWKKGNKSQNSDYHFNVRRQYLQVKLGDKIKPRSSIARCNFFVDFIRDLRSRRCFHLDVESAREMLGCTTSNFQPFTKSPHLRPPPRYPALVVVLSANLYYFICYIKISYIPKIYITQNHYITNEAIQWLRKGIRDG